MKRTSARSDRPNSSIVEFVVVDAAHHDHVELQLAEHPTGRPDRVEDTGVSLHARHRDEALRAQRVEAHRNPTQTGGAQGGRQFRQMKPVGRERKVLDRRQRGQPRHEFRKAASQKWLTTGEPDLLHADAAEQRDETLDLLERQEHVLRQPGVSRSGMQ